ncbi:uncharacterized protein [Pagrus major]|uniref:uncharacterized protein n=1 Tax=Pagrus major TaxID=143350 RepID=UPI003CC8C7C3
MFAVCAIALLCLVSLSHSAPLACEDLVRPVDQLDPAHLEGTWTLVAGGMSSPEYREKFKTRDSASISFVNGTTFTRVFGSNDSCQYLNSNITLEGSSFDFAQYNVTVTFLHTSCQDCILLRFDNMAKEVQRVYLFSRKREVEQKEMDEFTAQTQCLNLLPPVVKDPTKPICPGKMSNDAEAQPDAKTE